MRLLVTGAAGFIGSHLCERLVAEGHEVVGVDSFSDYYARARKESNVASLREDHRFSLREDDLVVADLPALLDGIDGIFHLAAQPGVRGSWGERFDVYVRNNITATQRLLEAIKAHAPSVPVVVASSSSVYGATDPTPLDERAPTRPMSPYGVTKLAAEGLATLYARAYGMRIASLRYFTVFGPRQRPDMAFTPFITAALEGRPLQVFGDGEASRDFTFVADAVDATVRALDGPPGVYNVGGGIRATVNEAIGKIEQIVGRPVTVEHLEPVPGDVRHTAADTSRARAILGWSPATGLPEGLRAQVDWLRSEPGRRNGPSRGEALHR